MSMMILVLFFMVCIWSVLGRDNVVVVGSDDDLKAYTAYNEGVSLEQANDFQGAEEKYRLALTFKGDLLESINNLGGIYKERQDYAQAEALYSKLYNKSLEKDDKWLLSAACNNLGLVKYLQSTSGVDQEAAPNDPRTIRTAAIPFYLKAIEYNPELVDAWYNLANAYQLLGEYDRAYKYYLGTLELNPNHVKANMNLGNLFMRRNRFDLAAVHHRRAVEGSSALSLDTQVDSLNNLGQTLREHGDVPGALECHEKAWALDGSNVVAIAQSIVAKRTLCLWDNWEQDHALLHKLLRAKIEVSGRVEITPYDSLLMPPELFSVRPLTLGAVSRSAVSAFELDKSRLVPSRAKSFPERINIGYISYDMTDHPMGHLTHGLLANHDRSRFRVHVYMYGELEVCDQRTRIETSADKFVDLAGKGADVAAELIQQDNIDILIDLMAHTRGARVEIPALLPAATYVNYLGYPGTSGFSFPGAFILVDRVTLPIETMVSGDEVTEQAVYLPDSYQANEYNHTVSLCPTYLGKRYFDSCQANSSLSTMVPVLDRNPLAGKPFRFANFNSLHKFEPVSFKLWMRILKRVPNSVMFFLKPKEEQTERNLINEAIGMGIDRSRILFAPRTSKAKHLDRLVGVDLFLDTIVYGAHSTASDVLWSGVPVVSLEGVAFAGRVGSSFLQALDMGELVVHTLDEFEDVAVRIGLHPTLGIALRKKLARSIFEKGLFQTTRITRHVEHALLGMQERVFGSPSRGILIITPSTLEGNRLEKWIGDAGALLQANVTQCVHICHRVLSASRDRVTLAQAMHILGIALKDAMIVQKSIALAPPFLLVNYLGNLGHLYRDIGDYSKARVFFYRALETSLDTQQPDHFPVLFESLVHLCFTIDPTQPGADADRIFGLFNRFSLKSQENIARGLDSIGNYFLSRNNYILAVKFVRAASSLFSGREYFRRRYQLGVLLKLAGLEEDSLKEQLETVVAENKFVYQPLLQDDADDKRPVIAIYCHEYGQTWWPRWGPRSPEQKGVGGSEEAVIFLSRELVKLGYRVEIYADPLEEDFGVTPASGGVIWLPHSAYNIDRSVDVFVAWRYHISLALGSKAKRRYLWLHDVVDDLGSQIELLVDDKKVDLVLGGSRFHLRTLPVSVQKVSKVLGYALQEGYFEDGPNDRYEFIYASAPNRGLEQLLEIWPQIHASFPKATLRVYYGFSNTFMKWGEQSIANFHSWVNALNSTLQNTVGVEYVGMVKHRELAVAYARAGFSLYPTSFPETGCVSLMKAQAMGAIPITSRFENSSIPDLTKLWDLGPRPGPKPINQDPAFLQAYLKAVLAAVARLDLYKHRQLMKEWARTELLWSTVAKRFKSTITH